MATYNGARYLAGQLQSILAGTMLPDEIVISDDGSSDETLEIVRQIASASPVPITLLTPAERRGPSGNFERALEATTGQIIALCDQDDLWHVDRLERAVEAFRGRGPCFSTPMRAWSIATARHWGPRCSRPCRCHRRSARRWRRAGPSPHCCAGIW